MCLQVSVIDHERLAVRPRLRQLDEDPGENPHARPANEPVVERLLRAVDGRRILPLQPILFDVDYRAQYAMIIDPRPAARFREERPQPLRRLACQPEMPAHHAPSVWELEPRSPGTLKLVYGS